MPNFFRLRSSLKYCISANSFRGNYSLLNLALCVTVHKSAETIQGRKLFKGGNYFQKYGKHFSQYEASVRLLHIFLLCQIANKSDAIHKHILPQS